jgi:hypothetical protein
MTSSRSDVPRCSAWTKADVSRRSAWTKADVARRNPWSKDDIRCARQAPLKPVLEQLGYRLEPRTNDNYAINAQCGEIVIKAHYWNCPATGQAGNAIDFLMRIRGSSFHDAMTQLTQPTRS